MKVELRCADCGHHFPADVETTALDRIQEEGPWLVLGDGQTLEDRIHADLLDETHAGCPECGHAVAVTEESLGELSREVLAHW